MLSLLQTALPNSYRTKAFTNVEQVNPVWLAMKGQPAKGLEHAFSTQGFWGIQFSVSKLPRGVLIPMGVLKMVSWFVFFFL